MDGLMDGGRYGTGHETNLLVYHAFLKKESENESNSCE